MRIRIAALIVALALTVVTAVVLSGCGTEVVTTSEARMLNTVAASGEGKQAAAPDRAEMTFGATEQGADAKMTLSEASNKADAIVSAIKQAGVPTEDIQTTGVSLFPQYEYTEGKVPSIIGYQASVQVRVTLKDIEKIGDVINAASTAGATDISGPSWTLSEDAEARATAIEKAVADAKARAEVMAKAAGRSIGEVVSLSEAGVSVPIIYGEYGARSTADAAEAAPIIEVGTLDIMAQVTVVFELK